MWNSVTQNIVEIKFRNGQKLLRSNVGQGIQDCASAGVKIHVHRNESQRQVGCMQPIRKSGGHITENVLRPPAQPFTKVIRIAGVLPCTVMPDYVTVPLRRRETRSGVKTGHL